MIRAKYLLLTLVFALLAPSLAHADVVADYYKILKKIPAKYTIEGTVCEQIAKLEAEKTYSEPEYTVLVGIVYKVDGRTVGELDLVVMENRTNEAIIVGEVKCRHNLNGALAKANDQLSRFEHFVGRRNCSYEMYLADNKHKSFKTTQFDENPTFITIAQKGAAEAGFTQDLPLTLNQATTLRHQLVRCQMSGLCPQAQN